MWEAQLLGRELYYVFYIFILYSVGGWIYESTLVSVQKKSFINRGFLTGPVIPIYGCGALAVYLVFWDYRNNLLLVFFGGILLATILEYITSLVMELLFHTRWWDYSKHKFNLHGRICLSASLIWGFLSILMLHVFQPVMDSAIALIPRKTGEIVGYVIIPFFLYDTAMAAVTSVK
ncbi:MAG: putative ABC transporter permease, partial [Mobilitalea sp.]